MPTFNNRRRLEFTPAQMFDLVADVERYPEFVPLCESLKVTSRETRGDAEIVVAKMGVGYKAIRESFATRITLQREKYEILVEYLDGPFSHLENRWRFLPVDDGCEVDFYLDYEFRSRMLALVMGAVFDKAFAKFSTAFEARAGKIYRPRRGNLGSPGTPAWIKP
ncbi:MAG: type II toxin-antitoxin system RatA family toxin [Alphaproteobacteria bacterium]|nr:type II toxin-antitoxin system RatA family toxin [Alphaproteobacteria bacterium]